MRPQAQTLIALLDSHGTSCIQTGIYSGYFDREPIDESHIKIGDRRENGAPCLEPGEEWATWLALLDKSGVEYERKHLT
jgi:hypothetical protein